MTNLSKLMASYDGGAYIKNAAALKFNSQAMENGVDEFFEPSPPFGPAPTQG